MTAQRASAREFIALVADGFHELPQVERESPPDGPLGWPGYDASRERAARRTGESESVVCGVADVEGVRAVLIAFEFGFLGGSLGERTGDRLVTAYAYAREHRLPVVPLVATGGSRMQEGMLALTQLQRVARESALTREAGLAQIAVLRDPTTGGGWATLGAGADVVLALPGAQVGFAGSRVRPPDADPAAYTAEAQLTAGAADAVVPATELRNVLGRWLRLLARGTTSAAGADAHSRPEETAHAPAPPGAAPGTRAPVEPARAGRSRGDGSAAYRPGRGAAGPCAGTTACAGLLGRLLHRPARDLRRPVRRRRPGGDAVRLRPAPGPYGRVRGADRSGDPARRLPHGRAVDPARRRLGIPVLTLVDTPGAANDAEAERQGAGAAIADLFGAVATARTPLTTLVIGEGGSGGALALAAPGRTWATPDSYFSVIAPESAAAILKRPPQEADATADQLRLRPQDLAELGVIRTDQAHGTQDSRAYRP